MQPIQLVDARRVPSKDATFKEFILQPLRSHQYQGSYHSSAMCPERLPYVPPLRFFLVQKLAEFPEQVYLLGGHRSSHERSPHTTSFDIVRACIPHNEQGVPDLSAVDPRTWATIVQLYSGLPEELQLHNLPLADQHLPLLQQIPITNHFSLMTILELPRCPELTDSSITKLRDLKTLCALDISMTRITAHGIRQLCSSLNCRYDPADTIYSLTGPSGLRILRLAYCHDITNDVYPLLSKFPLMSAVGQ